MRGRRGKLISSGPLRVKINKISRTGSREGVATGGAWEKKFNSFNRKRLAGVSKG